MPNQFLKLRRSAVPGRIPSTSSLDFGEIALNTYDGLAFIKKSGSLGEEIVTIGASTISVTGSRFFIPVFNTTSSLITSSIYQSGSFTAIGATAPVDPLNPDSLFINAGNSTSHTLLSGYGNTNNYLQLNIKNLSAGATASSDIVATADNGDETNYFVDLGINNSGYNITTGVGAANDSYLFNIGGDLLIGNASTNKRIILFNGGTPALDNARIYITQQGTVGINASDTNDNNPEALLVEPLPGSPSNTFKNLIIGRGTIHESYLQLNIINQGTGSYASADIVATNNIGTETSNYIDMGINSSNHIVDTTFTPGGPNDTYLLSTGRDLLIGSSTSGSIILWTGTNFNDKAGAKLTLRNNNIHSLTGSLSATQGFTGSLFGTASWAQNAVTASYILQAVSASFATTASSADDFTVRGTLTAQTIVVQTITSSVDFVTGSTRFGTLSSNTHQFTGSVSITGSLNVTGPTTINNLTGSLFGTASWANNAISSSYILQAVSASFATSASQAQTASFVNPLNQQVIITGSLIQGLEGNIATGEYSHAEGSITKATGDYSHAEGDNTQAKGNYSHAEGQETIASGSYSHAEGLQTIALANHQHVQGQYNSVSSIPAAFIVGNGTDDSNRNNLIYAAENEVQISGSLKVSGSITGSLFGTASWANNATTASYILQAVSASFATSASFVTSASFALNGGVTQLLAGPNVTLSPTNGLGQVTISSTGGGSSFNTATGSYGSFYDTTTQTNVAGTARSMSLNTTDITNGVSISGSTDPFNTYIKTENAGVYNIQFSAQIDKSDSGKDEIWIWLRKNGINLTDTATSVQLTGNADHQVAAWNFFANAAAGDYFQLMWYSPDANVRLHAEPAFGVVPGIPSLIVTANRIDQFLSNTGSFSGSFAGSLLGTASFATTASFALNAGAGSGFPFSGAAVITGSLLVSGSGLTVIGTTNITGSLAATGVIRTDTAISDATNARILNPKGGVKIWQAGDPDPVVGAISITYPDYINGIIKVRVKDDSKKTFTVTIYSRNYDGYWTEGYAYIEGNADQDLNFNIYYDNNFPVVYIGESSTAWARFGPNIWIEEVILEGGSLAIAEGTWSIGWGATTNGAVIASNTDAHNFARSGNNAYYNLGNVGIGTTSPLTTLDVSGSGRFTNNLTVTGSLTVSSGSAVELQVLNTGVKIGSVSSDIHTVTGSLRITGSQSLTGSLGILGTVSASSFTGSLLGTAATASYVLNAVSASFASTASSADNFLVRGTLTAQTIVAQTITSSTDFVTGSTRFGSLISNTHQFTGSVSITGSLTSPNITGSLFGTASFATSASQALTASFALNAGGGSSNITIGDESITQGTATYLNFIGAGVTAAVASNTASITIPGGGGGGTNAKAGSGSAASFGGTPRTASITFGSAFSDNLYAVTVTGEDARTFTIESKSSTGFTINSNSSVALTGPIYWIATAFN